LCIRIKDGETNTIHTKCVVQDLRELMWPIPKNISYVEREASWSLTVVEDRICGRNHERPLWGLCDMYL
jgi:hypothetical protein